MECWGLSKRKSCSYWSLMLMMIHILMVRETQGDCIEEERKALLQIKASHINSYDSNVDDFLPTWVDYGSSTPGDGGGDCCDWERVSCNTPTGHVTDLSLYNLRGLKFIVFDETKLWPLNVSLFLPFKELTSLNLSYNYLDKGIKAGLGKLSSLKKLEVLDLRGNDDIDNDILPSLMTLTSLKILDLSHIYLNGYFSISEFAALENLEMLNLHGCFNGKFKIPGSERVSMLRKLKTLDLSFNGFNESVITSLNTLSSLTNLDLNYNPFLGPFPVQELIHLTKLEKLDLSITQLNNTPDIQACQSLSRLKMLETVYLLGNSFNTSIISCLSALPSLKILDLSYNRLGGSFPVQGLASFHHLEVLDLRENNFVGSVPSAIHALSSLRYLSFAYNNLNGSLPDEGLCELKNLQELDLSGNMLHGTLPQCLNNISSLKLLDISSNRFTGILVPSLIANLTSLKYIDFSHNKFEGSFTLSSFSNHSKLELLRFSSDNDKFEVETEEPVGWIPMFQLEILELSNCNMHLPKGRVIPGFLLHQHKLRELDMSQNSLEGPFPNWLIKNNMYLEVLSLRNNSFDSMPLYWSSNMKWLDMYGNGMTGTIPDNIPKFFPNIQYLNLSMNALNGVVPSSIGELSELWTLDLSDNGLLGEVPNGLFTNLSQLRILRLSKNKLHGQVLSGNLSWGNYLLGVYLDSNHFTGKIGIKNKEKLEGLNFLDISNNFFTGMIPDWIGNMGGLHELVVRNNSLEGRFPCGIAPFGFLDISQNSFSGPIPSCSNLQYVRHLHLGSNRFTGSIPNFYCNLTSVLTLDIGDNDLSGKIPEFIGELSNLRILLLRKNKFSGSIPKQLCQLRDVSLIDLSYNSLSGSIPICLQNITGPSDVAFMQTLGYRDSMDSSYNYRGILRELRTFTVLGEALETQDEVEFTTKELFLNYKGDILDYMAGLDFSCNKLTGEIPQQLGLLTQIRALNLSHNKLTGPIPINFSNLANLESLDLSSNGLTGKVPSELIKLNYLSVFNVSHNHLSGRLPELKAQFGTFTEASYEGNPLLCGPPLVKKCMTNNSHVTNSSVEEDNEKWYDIDMTCFYASSGSTCVVLLLGFVALLYINPHWRRRWLDWVEDCMLTCYCFLYDSVRKLSIPSHK